MYTVYRNYKGQKNVSRSLETKLNEVVSCRVGTETEPRSSA